MGRPLGVIDTGGPCNKGSFSDLENFCSHARYYVASDLPNGGYTPDDWTIEKHRETDPESQYHRLFAETSSLQEALVGRIDIRRRRYEYSRINMTESRTQQANYLAVEGIGRGDATRQGGGDNPGGQPNAGQHSLPKPQGRSPQAPGEYHPAGIGNRRTQTARPRRAARQFDAPSASTRP